MTEPDRIACQMIFPIYNDQAGYTPAKCEVDSCNEHVGQGGGGVLALPALDCVCCP